MKPMFLRTRPVMVGLWTAILLASFLAACDNPSRPSPLPGQPSVFRLEIAGPDSVPPGGAQQLKATAYFTTGPVRDVTAEVSWTSSDSTIVSVSSSGLATGRERGETDIRASYSQLASTKRLMVLPPGTFKLSGRVQDANLDVTDARVEVTAGSATGLSTLSKDGRYALYGVSGPTQLTVSKDGYQSRVENIDVNVHRTLDIFVVPLGPPWDPSGTYTLTIGVAPECRSTLPAELWARTYKAVLTLYSPNPRFVNVSLEGAAFVSLNYWFWTGRIGENSVTFENVDYYGPALVQNFAESKFFFIESQRFSPAKAVVTRSPSSLEGPLEGTIEVGEGAVWYTSTRTAQCSSTNHRFTFTR